MISYRWAGGIACVGVLLASTACGGTSTTSGTTTISTSTTSTTVLEPPTGTAAAINTVIAGQCFNHASDPTQRDLVVLRTPCEATHRFEVYATFTIPIGGPKPASRSAPYPDETTVRTAAEQACLAAFEPWMANP